MSKPHVSTPVLRYIDNRWHVHAPKGSGGALLETLTARGIRAERVPLRGASYDRLTLGDGADVGVVRELLEQWGRPEE